MNDRQTFAEGAVIRTAHLEAVADMTREIQRLTAEIAAKDAEIARLREALVQHNDRLRSAMQVAARDGRDTNWLSFRGQCTYTLAEYHEITNDARAALSHEARDD